MSLAEHTIICGGAGPPPGDATGVLTLATGAAGNIVVRLSDVSRKLAKDVPARVADLIEIASYVFCADQATSRGGPAFRAMGADWRRSFHFRIPVREPELWSAKPVIDCLRSTLEFLSDDRFDFEFVPATDPAPFPEYLDFALDDEAVESDEVVLFSGGLDSLAGVLERLHEGQRRLLLVSHRSATKVLDYQTQLVADLKARFPGRLMHIPVRVHRRDELPVREFTQRSRSFLYAAIACSIAHQAKIDRVTFFENGIVSINLPLSEQEVGSRSTRTTHPDVIRRFSGFFEAALGAPLHVANPFIWKTKAELVAKVVELGHGDLIGKSISCSHVHEMSTTHPHCGRCSQCIDRRFSALAAGGEAHDPARNYAVDLFEGPRLSPEDRAMVERYVALALEMADATEVAFMDRFAGEVSRVILGFPQQGPHETLAATLDLHNRHWRGVAKVVDDYFAANGPRLVRGQVDANSLLAMLGARNQKKPARHAAWIEEEIAELSVPKKASSKPARKPRGNPALEMARKVIQDLYPGGVPDQTELPNVLLCRAVAKRWKFEVSNDTILRAAGRRRDRN